MLQATLTVPAALAQELERILAIEEFDEHFEDKDCSLYGGRHTFEDGVTVVFEVFTGQTNAWVDILWLDPNNTVISEGEPAFHLLGALYLFNDKNNPTHEFTLVSA